MKKIVLMLCSLFMATNTMAQDGEPKTIVLTDAERKLVESNNHFAFRVFQEARGEENKILSPLSITYALGMMNNGAAGQTQKEINEVLGFGEAGADGINRFCRKLLSEAPLLDEETEVEMANTIYVNSGRGYELQQGFIDLANEFYDATPESRNFYDGETRNAINRWASDHTHGMVPQVFPTSDSFDESAASYLLNALYFKGVWVSKFDKENTHDESFNGGAQVPMMSQQGEFDYTENKYYQAIRLPYGNGAYLMTVFLPSNIANLYGLINLIKDGDWQFKSDGQYKVNLKLPRFKTDSHIPLKEVMWELGMHKPFDPSAEFPYFGNQDVFIGDMFQKAVIDLNEEGTEAAAVTVIDAKNAMPREVTFHANRPFLYIISEKSTGAIFFIGQYTGVTEKSKKSELEIPMLGQGKTWHYTYHHFEEKEEPTGDSYPKDFYDETLYMVSYTLQGDTIIDGRDYMKMYRRYENGSRKYYGAFREDEEGRVWQYNLKGDKQDFMLCDVTCSSYPGPDYMTLPDVINIYGQLLHRYRWEGLIGVEGVGLEGKGLVLYPFGDEPDCICDYESFAYVEGGGIFFTDADFRAPKYIQLTTDEQQLVARSNDFAFRLFSKACNAQPSMVLSPLSVTYALGLVNNGAGGQTQQEICDVLGFGNVNAQNEFCLKMLNELAEASTVDAATKTSIANTIFINEGMGWRLQYDFKRNASYYYYAFPEARNFADGKTRDVINQWASDNTEGMIKEVLSEQEYNPYAVSYLLNAIYFKGLWSSPFEAANTREEPFADGGPVPMMHKENMELQYAENNLYQTVVLPYGNGSYQMQVFLPREGKTLDELTESLASNPSTLTSRYRVYEVDMKLPRFESSTDIDLKTIMSELGMPTAFDPYAADFTKLCENNHGENLFIGLMKQVAKIEVNEQGTEAAAVTVIGYDATGMPSRATFHANRPFLYTISEQSTGIILFMGQYVGDTATAISSIVNSKWVNGKCFDLQGRQVVSGKFLKREASQGAERSNGPLKKGIYIINGKKIVNR